jgi:hypothetical protein
VNLKEEGEEREMTTTTIDGKKVLDVYESFDGWYWYITHYSKKHPEGAYGFVRSPLCEEGEWGDIYLPDLFKVMRKGMLWKVPKRRWEWTRRKNDNNTSN